MIKQDGFLGNEGMTKSDRIMHTPGNFARQHLLYVQEVGRLQSLAPHRCIREKLDSFLFLIVLKGKGCLNIKGKDYHIQKGDCALVDCMEHYEHISDADYAWQLGWVHFNGHIARAYYDLFMRYNNQSNVFPTSDIEKWSSLLDVLLNRQNDRSLIAELTCGDILLQMLNYVIESVSHSNVAEGERDKITANEMREYLNEKYADNTVLVDLEKAFSQKVPELNTRFGKYMGISVEEYVSNRRLNAAKELLRFTIKPVEEVAKESGIEDMIAMQQMFRENEGMSAEEYRMKWAQWIK